MRLLLILVVFAISIMPTYAEQMTYFNAEKNELSVDSLIGKLRPQRAVRDNFRLSLNLSHNQSRRLQPWVRSISARMAR